MINNNILRTAIIAGVVIALMLAAYAFASSNEVNASFAGSGDEDITPFTVSNVDYTLAADPLVIDKWTFTISPAASEVRSRLSDNSSLHPTEATWVTCTNLSAPASTSTTWECNPTSSYYVENAVKLQVVAINNQAP